MKYLITIILLILITTTCHAQYKEFWGCRIKTGKPDFDGWSMMHAGGGAVMYSGILRIPEYLDIFEIKPKHRLLITIALGYFYEIYKDGYGNPIPGTGGRDGKGADLKGDPVWTAFGAGFACILEQVLKTKKYKLMKTKDGITVLVEF